jgi:hypothetical protein
MQTSWEAACLRTYYEMLPDSAARENNFHQRRVTTPSIIALIYALHAPTFQMMHPIKISCTKMTAKGFVASSYLYPGMLLCRCRNKKAKQIIYFMCCSFTCSSREPVCSGRPDGATVVST